MTLRLKVSSLHRYTARRPSHKFHVEHGGRIYRDGDAGRLHIGKIDAILDGSARPLKINEINTYTLRASTAGDLFCDVFWDTETGGVESANTGEPVVASVSGPTVRIFRRLP